MSNTVKKVNFRAAPNSLSQADHVRNAKAYNVPSGHTIEDLMIPEYWANEAKKVTLLDRIELRAEDLSFWAEAIVVAKSATSVKLFIIQHHKLSGENKKFNEEIKDKYEIKFRGLKGHSVVRKSDKSVISDEHGTISEAEQALEKYLKEMGG